MYLCTLFFKKYPDAPPCKRDKGVVWSSKFMLQPYPRACVCTLGPRYCGDVITEEFEEPPKPLCLPTTLCQFPGDS